LVPSQIAYHIHVDPVPSDGNCSATLGHLDPYERGDTPACNASEPEICQAGDLSGKHGKMSPLPGSSWQLSYFDMYLSTEPGDDAFFGNRSIVVHSNNKTRLACANFNLLAGSATPTRVIKSSASSASASAPASSTSGGAVARFVSVGAMLAGVGGLVAFAL
jgi:hypothetical protein